METQLLDFILQVVFLFVCFSRAFHNNKSRRIQKSSENNVFLGIGPLCDVTHSETWSQQHTSTLDPC